MRILTAILVLLSINGWAQQKNLCAPPPPQGGSSCERPYDICEFPYNYQVFPAQGGNCLPTTRYFKFYLNNSHLELSISEMVGTYNSYYLYGPFASENDLENACDLLSPNNAAQGQVFNPAQSTFDMFVPTSTGWYLLLLNDSNCNTCFNLELNDLDGDGSTGDISCPTDTIAPLDTCESCVGSFALIPGKRYLMTAWAKEDGAPLDLSNYDNPEIYIDFTLSGGGTTTVGPFKPKGQIIDSWQRIEEEFDVPSNAIAMSIRLQSASGDVYFDDIRILPFDASMKTYVYDPVFMRLAAELDERHYATFYEYDEEGKLIRIKKETEKGIMTIQETRNNSSK